MKINYATFSWGETYPYNIESKIPSSKKYILHNSICIELKYAKLISGLEIQRFTIFKWGRTGETQGRFLGADHNHVLLLKLVLMTTL
jgi:hypothetical protein